MRRGLGILISFVLLGLFPVSAVASTWIRSYGGPYTEYANSVQETSDGGFILAGYAIGDFWVLKLDVNGNITWQKSYGGSYTDQADSIQETSDGGFIVAGHSGSNAGTYDFWVLKLDANGNVVWQKRYGGSSNDFAHSVQETSDGRFIVAGSTGSYGAGSDDFWVLKLDANGNVVWQKAYGGSSYECVNSIQETSDGGFIVAGYGSGDFWVLKLDASGNVIWQKKYGDWSGEVPNSIQETSDGGFIVAGWTDSFGAGSYDYWILKLDASGHIVWQKTYGGPSEEYPDSIRETSDGEFIVAGRSYSYGAGHYDYWVLKLDASGHIVWQKTYGGPYADLAHSIWGTSDGGFIVVGQSASYGGSTEAWILKLDASGSIPECEIIQDSSAVPIDTNVSPSITFVTPEDTDAAVTSTMIVPENTAAFVDEQCFFQTPLLQPFLPLLLLGD